MLYLGDCLDILPTISQKIDLVLVDLPYGQTNNGWDVCIDLKSMWGELKKICKESCVYIFFTTTKYGVALINSNPSWFRYDLIWEKSKVSGYLQSKMYQLRTHEMIYVFINPKRHKINKTVIKPIYNPQMSLGKPYNTIGRGKNKNYNSIRINAVNLGTRYPKSILKFNNEKKTVHSTQKPVLLLEYLIKTYSNEKDTVLDFTMGSGSTGVACRSTKRLFIGIEKDKDIYYSAVNRLW